MNYLRSLYRSLYSRSLLLGFVLSISLKMASAQAYSTAKLADGFDYAVGKPDSKGYYKFRGFISYAHAGDD